MSLVFVVGWFAVMAILNGVDSKSSVIRGTGKLVLPAVILEIHWLCIFLMIKGS